MSLLNEIQQKLKVPKGQYNAFAKYNYRNAEDILEAVKPLMGSKGILVLTDDVVEIGGRIYVRSEARFYEDGVNNQTGGFASSVGYAREEETKKGMDAAQITGAASSYARKYALNGLFCIDDTKDADNHDNSQNAATASKTAPQRAEAEDEALSREKAKKDRIVANLKRLGKPVKNKEEVSQAVFDLVGMELVPEKYDDIGEALGKLNK